MKGRLHNMKKHGHILLKVALAVAFVVTLYAIIDQQLEQNELVEQYEKLYAEVERYSDEVDELAYDFEICDTPEYFEKAARKLGFCKFGETVFINDRQK